ncbi:MAG TPA: flagellar biosynthetic protein FliR [Rhizomicrobium sp.]|nr:flagellar biosynthetic protein FliR [Rhizomicrobium sp.]
MLHIHLPQLSGAILTYLLVFARTGTIVMLLPALGQGGIPARIRLALALAITVALTPTVAHNYPATAPGNVLQLALLIAQEATAGVLIGGMSSIIMSALQVAGYLIATQTGLAYAQTIDPTQHEQGAVIGNFFSLLGAVLIFSTDLHHLAIGAIAGSYRLLPPGAALPTGDMAELVIRMVSAAFILGFQLAAPFLVFGFALYAALGILARLMPQLQVFFVAMPINILFGFVLFSLLLGSMMTLFLNFFAQQMGQFQ